MMQIITRKFPVPTDIEMVMDDPTAPMREKIVLVPELERRNNDINEVPPMHPSLAAHHLQLF